MRHFNHFVLLPMCWARGRGLEWNNRWLDSLVDQEGTPCLASTFSPVDHCRVGL
jgi:hypothetical protein